MRNFSIVKLCALSLGFLVLCSPPTYAKSLIPPGSVITPQQQKLDPQRVLKQFAKKNVIYLGETHDSADDHKAQLAIIQALHHQNPRIAIAMEMFQRPYQAVLDRYLAGAITEAELKTQSEYDKRWGFDWEFYAPILRFAKTNRIPVIALNTPSEITRKVARQGLASLTEDDRRFIPPISEIRTEPTRYRDRMREIYEGIHQGKSNSRGFESFFLAQVLWDETMAESVSQFLKANPNQQIIVLAGQGHLLYGDGIPSRVARRIPQVKQSIVLLNPPEELKTEAAIADYFWISRITQ